MNSQHSTILLDVERFANDIIRSYTGMIAILAAGSTSFDDPDPNSTVRARAGEALRGALGCLPSLETELRSLEEQISGQGDSQGSLGSHEQLVDRFCSAMIVFQTRSEDALELQKLNLLRDRAKLRQIHNRWITPHPISQLPPELLSYIFLFVDTIPDFKEGSADLLSANPSFFKSGRLPAPVVLSHVCTDWRSIALGTASMWNWIHVRGGDASLSRVGTCLARSGGLPLHLDVLLEDPHHPSDVANTLLPYVQRIQDMQILIRSATGIEFLPLLANANDPSATYQLRVLKVHHNRREYRFSGGFLRFLEHQRTLFSRLDLLVLNGVGILGWPNWQVEKIQIHLMDDIGRTMTWYQAFGAILLGLPLLKELDVCTLFDLEDGAPDQVLPSIARFPSLSRIKVRGPASIPRRLFAVVDAPSLSSLEMDWLDSITGHIIPPVMREFVRRHPSLQRLKVVGIGDNKLTDTLELFPFAPSLETLILHNSYGPGSLALARVQVALPNLPNLRHLEMGWMDISLGLLKAFLLNAQPPLSMQLVGCIITSPAGSYPEATDLAAWSLLEADMEKLARDMSEHDVALTWSQTAFDLDPER